MKKIIVSLLLILSVLNSSTAMAHSCSNVYLVNKDVEIEQVTFPNCKQHSMRKETTTYLYSNGQKRKLDNSTIFNFDGSTIENNCSNVEHIIFNNKHYFTFYKNKKYTIIDDKGRELTVKQYTRMKEIEPNRLLVRFNKKYGIIDLFENIIVPIKYKSIEKIEDNLYKTELNNYYGFINSDNKIILKNEYDKITQVQNTFIIKKKGKFGLADKKGNIILNAKYDKIKEIDDYIIVKNEKQYKIYNTSGEKLTNKTFKDVKLDRNTLKVKTFDNQWINFKADNI